MPPPRFSGEAVKHLQSIDIALKERIKGINRSLRIRADRAEGNGGTGYNPQRHDAEQALGIHLPVVGLQPDAALKLICLLHNIWSLAVVQPGFTTNNNFLIEHPKHSFSSHLRKMRRVLHYHTIFIRKVNLFSEISQYN